MASLATYQAGFTPRRDPFLEDLRRRKARAQERGERRRYASELAAQQPSTDDRLFEKQFGHGLRMSELEAGAEQAEEAREAERGFRREMGETGFGQQKELLGLKGALGEEGATADFGRLLKQIQEKGRLRGEEARGRREHDVDMFGRRSDLSRDLQFAREGAAERMMASRLGAEKEATEGRQTFEAGESELDRAFRAKEAERKRDFGGEQLTKKLAAKPSAREGAYQTETGKIAARFGVVPDELQKFLSLPPIEQEKYMAAKPRFRAILQALGGGS